MDYVTENAIVVQRVEPHQEPDTREIEELARAAGYNVAAVLTQTRTEDTEYNIGEGKVPEMYHAAEQHDAATVIIDNELGPYQMYNLGVYVSQDITIYDRYTLVLHIFEQRATTKKAQLQVELAQLRYELARAETKVRLAKREERPGYMGLGEYDESRERDIKDRIKRIRKKLSKIEEDNKQRREQRREQGFDLVAIAGYTNAGKSTLLRRLAEDHTVDENDDLHEDLDPTAEASEQFFTTLDTTTRRMAFDKRDVLLTDTVGFIEDLPHWLVDAFTATFDSIYRADLVLLVFDVRNSVDTLIRRIASCHDILSQYDTGRIITVFNKCDAVSADELEEKKQAVKALAPNPISVSALDGAGTERLKNRMHTALPPYQTDTLRIPWREETMEVVSWIHENAYVRDSEYTSSEVVLTYEAQPEVVDKARSKTSRLEEQEPEQEHVN